jgi:hypothetical protein
METKIYGASDDLIEFEGDYRGEVSYHTPDRDDGDDPASCLIVVSDGTLLAVRYGKNDEGIWEVKLVKKGALFDRIDQCDDADAEIYSDVAHFRDGIKWVYAASRWEKVA